MALFCLEDQAIYLSLDRTNWKWGQRDINILMLSVVYKGIAWPVAWSFLDSQGNSDTEDRVAATVYQSIWKGADCGAVWRSRVYRRRTVDRGDRSLAHRSDRLVWKALGNRNAVWMLEIKRVLFGRHAPNSPNQDQWPTLLDVLAGKIRPGVT